MCWGGEDEAREYECNVRSYAVIPGVDIRYHACSHQYRVIKLNSTILDIQTRTLFTLGSNFATPGPDWEDLGF